MMTAADERENDDDIQVVPQRDATSSTKALIQKPRKYWYGSNFLRAVNACDKFFNCAYVKFQLEEELMEERSKPKQMSGSIERLLLSMDQGVEVEVYRQFLFEENGLEPYEDSYHHTERRDNSILERPQDQESRTTEQE